MALWAVQPVREGICLSLSLLNKHGYLLVVLEEPPHQDGGALFTVPDKLCTIRETASVLLIAAAAPAAAVLAAALGVS